MKKSDITYVVASVFVVVTGIFYCCTMWFGITLPRYYPLEHTWKWVKEKGVPSQGWYGVQVFAYAAAGAVAVIVYLVLKRKACENVELKSGAVKFLGVITTLVIVVCMGYMLYHEFGKWGIF